MGADDLIPNIIHASQQVRPIVTAASPDPVGAAIAAVTFVGHVVAYAIFFTGSHKKD